jgi:hypothetical protein
MTYADRPSAVIRQGPVQCVVTPRVERERGLLQVALAKRTCWGGSQLLPQELTAACDGTPLRCLTLAQTLDLLYGELARGPRTEAGEDTSFASVSEREDYLIPSNYRKLLQRLEKVHGRSFAKRPRPALVEVPEIEYPGPAVLGDARALAGFLQQREYVQPGEPVQAGWVMFAGDALRDRRQIQLAIDLGQGPLPLEFVLPES